MYGKTVVKAVEEVCGICNTPNGPRKTVLNLFRDGRKGFALKSSEKKAIAQVDGYTDISFPITANKMLDEFLGYPFVPLIDHPGVIVIVKEKNINDIVIDMIMSILGLWPLFMINLVLMFLAGLVMWMLVCDILISMFFFFLFFHILFLFASSTNR